MACALPVSRTASRLGLNLVGESLKSNKTIHPLFTEAGVPVYNTTAHFLSHDSGGEQQQQPGGVSLEKDVIISIKGVQRYENADPDTMELVTAGRLEREGNSYTLSYQESELTGLEGTLTTFQIEDGRITLMRHGEVNSQMVFEEGRRHLSMYNTPYGALAVGIKTHSMDCRMDDHGGSIEINYAIEIEHAVAGQNLFQIQVREKPTALMQ